MITFYNNLSPTTKLLIHGLLAIVSSAAVTGGEAGYQSFTQSGHLNPPALLVTAWSAFLLYLMPAMYRFVPAHAQQLITSISDEKAQLYDALQRAQTIKSNQNVPAVQAVAPHVVVQPAIVPALGASEIQSIASQIAMNLINLAAQRATQAVASTAPVQSAQPTAPAQPTVPPYVDPLRNSAVLPAYTPPADVASQPTQSVAAQVPFTV